MGATRLIDALTERESRSDVDLIGNLFELSVEDFFVAAAILGWSVDSDVDDDDEDADDEEPHWRSDSDASAEWRYRSDDSGVINTHFVGDDAS